MNERELLARLIQGPASGAALARAAGQTRAAIWKHVNALREAGVAIDVRPGRGYALARPLELLDAAAAYHAGDAAHVRESLIVRHALQPFSPAAYGAPHAGETRPGDDTVEPRRFSYDPRWQSASIEAAGTLGSGERRLAGMKSKARSGALLSRLPAGK